jgi:hypothetical protein
MYYKVRVYLKSSGWIEWPGDVEMTKTQASRIVAEALRFGMAVEICRA